MKKGTPSFDGLAIGELSANFMGGPGVVELKAKVAFINTRTNKTHGWTNHSTFSPAVIAKLKELTDLMEEEVARVQFSDVPGTFGGGSPPAAAPTGGLGEFLGAGDAPQV